MRKQGMETLPDQDSPQPKLIPTAISISRVPLHLLFGFILPCATLVIEIMTGMCGQEILDPLPTLGHVAVVAFVPLANLALLLLCYFQKQFHLDSHWWTWVDRANAWAAGIALSYTLLFLPLTPIALLAVPLFGLGLLPLAPLLSLISALRLRRSWRMHSGQKRGHWQIITGLLLAPVLCTPQLLGNWATQRLEKQPDSALALFTLRNLTPEDHLWSNAQAGGARRPNWAWLPWQSTPAARQVAYYRATGRSAQQADLQASRGWSGRSAARERRWDWDQGEQQIGTYLPELKLQSSSLVARADSASATGYVEWTMQFENAHEFFPCEARTLIQLPAGGVVCRLTLWIDGEEREAAFGGSSQVTQAYKAVVQQRRDPVLVIDRGADRVLMQCFPVPPRGGSMKVRIGVTYPLALADGDQARVGWPRFIARNFRVEDAFRHATELTSNTEIISGRALSGARISLDRRSVQLNLPTAALGDGSAAIEIAGSPAPSLAFLHPGDDAQIIRQTVGMRAGAGENLAIVLDGSANLAEIGLDLADALEKRPAGGRLALWFSGDRLQRAPSEDAHQIARWLRAQTFVGGQDNTRALEAACDEIIGRPAATLLWIHGPQPHPWTQTDALVQRLSRPYTTVKLIDYSVGDGANALASDLAKTHAFRRIDPQGRGRVEMMRLLREVIEPSRTTERAAVTSSEPADAHAPSDVVRLWVREEVDRLMLGAIPHRAEAVALAHQARLVTRVTGAVVLETQAQYDAAGLKPGESASGPSVPEPASAVVLAGLLVAGVAWRVRRKLRVSPHYQTST